MRQDEQWQWDTYTITELLNETDLKLIPVPLSVIIGMTLPVTRVWKKTGEGIWEVWVLVMESAALRTKNLTEYGLYAWKLFVDNDEIGQYSGVVIGQDTYDEFQDRESIDKAIKDYRQNKSQRDKI